jgi:hypothetical protein
MGMPARQKDEVMARFAAKEAHVLVSTSVIVLVPWPTLLSQVTPVRLALVSLISVFMPVPIALDVMFAAQIQQQGIASGYVMLFAMTLGTYSIIPSIYLWREVSKRLAVSAPRSRASSICARCVASTAARA